MPRSVQLSDEQSAALDAVLSWFGSGAASFDAPFLTLGGYAGTGKTTLIGELLPRISAPRVEVCAFTGKAAYVLRTKGISRARTIHSLIYAPRLVCKGCEQPLEEQEDVCTRLPTCKRAGTHTVFARVPVLELDLIIVDEASMVSSQVHDDLMSFGIPVLYVGDHGQLEPIGPNPRLMVEPKLRLETIHRQAEDSEILKFAHHVRMHRRPQTMGPLARVITSPTVPKDAAEYDVVIVGKNSTRVAVNAMVRRQLKFKGELPEVGEKIVCLRNSREHGVFNGMCATVRAIRCDDTVDVPQLDIVDDEGRVYTELPFEPSQFGAETLLDKVRRNKLLFDFGYALTCHKAQGSEWNRVLVVERIHPDTSAARWRYTAATRAKEELVWCMH